jgi:small-conductance mechanosensitive channel
MIVSVVNTLLRSISRWVKIINCEILTGNLLWRFARVLLVILAYGAAVAEVNTDPDKPPRVYFSDFNNWSLNIDMSYRVRQADYRLCQEVNQRLNLEMMKRFEAEKIEFAFPSQTVHLQKQQ